MVLPSRRLAPLLCSLLLLDLGSRALQASPLAGAMIARGGGRGGGSGMARPAPGAGPRPAPGAGVRPAPGMGAGPRPVPGV